MLELQVLKPKAQLKVDEGVERKKRHSGTLAPTLVSHEGTEGKQVDVIEEPERAYHSGSDGPSSPDPSTLSPSIRSLPP